MQTIEQTKPQLKLVYKEHNLKSIHNWSYELQHNKIVEISI